MERQIPKITIEELVRRYCERQEATVEEISTRLGTIQGKMQVQGFMLLECQMLDSSYMGSLTILPYGPGCSFKEVPMHPLSPRGLASDTSLVVAIAEVG